MPIYSSPSLNTSHSYTSLNSAQKAPTRFMASADKSVPSFLPPRPTVEIDLTVNVPGTSARREDSNSASKFGFTKQEYRRLQLIKAVR